MRDAVSALYVPTSCFVTPAGFVIGPRRLNIVLTPSSALGFAAYFIAGWNRGAKRNPTPTVLRQAPARSGGSEMLTPSALRRSALPLRLETERLPCFATVTPAPAATSDARVEMLNVPSPSPPVPHMSIACGSSALTFTDFSRIVRANPTSSSTVSPFARRATRSPAIWASDAWSVMISSSADEASSVVRSSPSRHFSMNCFIVMTPPPSSCAS